MHDRSVCRAGLGNNWRPADVRPSGKIRGFFPPFVQETPPVATENAIPVTCEMIDQQFSLCLFHVSADHSRKDIKCSNEARLSPVSPSCVTH